MYKKEYDKNVFDEKHKGNKEKLEETAKLYLRGLIIAELAKGYTLKSISKCLKDVVDELKSDEPILDYVEHIEKNK